MDKTGAALWIFVLGRGALGFAGLAVVKIISFARASSDAVLVIQTDIEPNWRVEGAVLIQAEPGQFIVKNLRCFRVREIAIGHAPIRDRLSDAMNQLAHRSLTTALVRVGAIGEIAVKVFRNRDFSGEWAP